MAERSVISMLLVTLCCLLLAVEARMLARRDAMSLSDGDAESIPAFYGFYGSPIYRPYGFTYHGYGSPGFMYKSLIIPSPNIYGGYI